MLTILKNIAVGLLGFYLLRAVLSQLSRRRATAPLPPGPRPLPIIGNLNDLPGVNDLPHLHFSKHKELYGPISSLTFFKKTVVILNDSNLAVELLDKRSGTTSARPHPVFASDLVGLRSLMVLNDCNAYFHAQRKAMNREVGTRANVARFDHIQEVEVARFLLRVLEDPKGLLRHFRNFREAGAIILKIAYGYTVDPHNEDPLIELADETMHQISLAMIPGAWLVDILPILRYLPSWFPGAGFQKTAAVWKATSTNFVTKPFEFVKRQMSQGNNEPSYTGNLLRAGDVKPGSAEEMVIKWSAAGIYSGGADTTVALMASFFLAMILYPEVQQKAQEEIDLVVGTDRLPHFGDRQNLPYINAMVQEVVRWHPVGTIGIPHVASEDETCGGYRIPQGAQIIAVIWSFTHDPDRYHDPSTFKPERFLPGNDRPPEADPRAYVFGFGRRVCPGRALADSNLYLSIANFLAGFKIQHAMRNGRPIPVSPQFLPGMISHPAPFEFDVQPRSSRHAALISSLESKHPWESSDAKNL